MPSHAASNPAIQQMYINGHFCYAFKFGIVTNGLTIVKDISFYTKDFLDAHSDIIIGKKSNSPDEDKSLADFKLYRHCTKAFVASRPSAVFCSTQCKNKHNVYKSRARKNSSDKE